VKKISKPKPVKNAEGKVRVSIAISDPVSRVLGASIAFSLSEIAEPPSVTSVRSTKPYRAPYFRREYRRSKMKKMRVTIFFSAFILSFMPQTAHGKDVKGPNISSIYRIPSIANQLPALSDKQKLPTQEPLPEAVQISFQRLFGVDRTLALEAGRVPAFQKNIKEKESLALARFTELLGTATPEQKTNLESLLNIGLKDSRRYSSVLEAIFWTLEKNDYDRNKQLLGFPLGKLLDKSWDFSDKSRWGDYETVTDRLNAPEVVNYYQRIRLVYVSRGVGTREGLIGHPRDLFVSGTGNCYDHSELAVYCLKKASYKTSVVGVHPSQAHMHVVCRYEANGKSYFIDNGRPDKFLRRGIIPKEEYEMYREKDNVRKGESTKDPIYLLQDNHGLVLIYLMDQKERAASVKAMCKDLGLSGYEKKVKGEYLPALIDGGFITKSKPHKGGGSEDFEYSINEGLCERFKAERYHRPQNAAAKW
jgi:hypothetical protein